MGLWASLKSDYKANFKCEGSWLKVLLGIWLKGGYRAVFLYRLARGARNRRVPVLGPILDRVVKWSCHIELCSLTDIGPGLSIPHPVGIVIGPRCKIGRYCHLLQGVTMGGSGDRVKPDGQGMPRVGDEVLLGAGAKLVGPVVVGDRTKVGANAVVVRDVPADAVVGGVPARILFQGGRRVDSDTGGAFGQARPADVTEMMADLHRRIEALEKHIGQ